MSKVIGVPPHIIALYLSPIATELPEILSTVIWVRQGKERLALGNISGSMMIQATISTAFGWIFTPWIFDSFLLAERFPLRYPSHISGYAYAVNVFQRRN